MQFKSKVKLTGLGTNKEGNESQDLASGMTLKLTAVLGTKHINEIFSTLGSGKTEEMFRGEASANALDDSFWDEKDLPRWYGIKSIALDKELNHVTVRIDENDSLVAEGAVLKGFVVSPTNEKGVWDASFSCYIQDPSDEVLAYCFHKLKSSILFEAEEVDVPAPADEHKPDPETKKVGDKKPAEKVVDIKSPKKVGDKKPAKKVGDKKPAEKDPF
jgi:hypothetical protein